MNNKTLSSIRDVRERVSTRATPFRITECGRRTTIEVGDGFTFDPGAGRRTVAFLASRHDAHGRAVDLAVVVAVCSDDGFLIDRLGELLVGLPTGTCLGVEDPEAFWREALEQTLQIVDVVAAHGCWAQREAAEAVQSGFTRRDWGCSRDEVDWHGLGFPSNRLDDIGARLGLLPQGRRAIDEARLLLAVLTCPDQTDGEPPLAQLLGSVDSETVRLFTGDMPAAQMPTLMRRGYRWSPGQDGAPEGFFIDRRSDVAQVERRFLAGLLGRDEADLLERPLPADQRYRLP